MEDRIITINDWVTVTLTQHGADILNQQHEELARRWPRAAAVVLSHTYVDGEAYEDQLWSLMSWFGGNYINIGQDIVFKDFQVGRHKLERDLAHKEE